MSANFPLYDRIESILEPRIFKNEKKNELPAKVKKELVANLCKLDKNAAELVLALIRTHQIKTSQASIVIPYNGTENGEDTIFDLDELPISLKHILKTFVEIHKESKEIIKN